MQRSTRFSRPGLKGSTSRSLMFSSGDMFVLSASPASTTAVNLAWTAFLPTPDTYRIERSTDGISFSTVTSAAADVFSYQDTGLTESTQYWYRIVPILGGTDQTPSNIADTWTVPSTPTTLTATAVGGTQIDLTWVDVSTGNTGQIIERRTPSGSGSYSLLATVSATATTYSDTGLTPGQSYEYRVAATNPATLSAYSNAASATPTSTYNVEYLVVAGGGAGGNAGMNQIAGGGGAGGYRTATGFTLTLGTSYTVTVGAGGALGSSGSNSVFSTITSTGGGRGGIYNSTVGQTGGSGGGAGGGSAGNTGHAGTSGEGNKGGDTNNNAYQGVGGGGGASAAGANGGGDGTSAGMIGGNGGAGTASSITGTSVTRAGGGGAGSWTASTPGTGGAGGGGNGAVGATNGTGGGANTGGGGGGGANAGGTAGAGGSGVVIIRMATANYSGTTSGSPTVTTSGSDTILTYNASGTYTA